MGAKAAAACPDENLLVSLIEGRLADDAVRALESHIDVCASCESVFGELAAVMAPASESARSANDVVIGRYQILGEVGAGAMGVVYAALDPELGRKVAVKLLRPDLHGSMHLSQARARLLREARLLAGLSHPNVLHVYEAGTAGDQVYIAVELIEGRSFDAWQRDAEPHGWRTIALVYAQAARGLSAAHRAGLVHRDVKPANFMLGDDGRVRVTDFGLATAGTSEEASGLRPSSRAETALKTASGAIVGTPAYMAPEQFAGRKVDARSDQFSFCVSLAEALTGERPTAGSTADDLVETRSGEKESIPSPLLALLARGLSARPQDRFESMEALLLEIEALLADATTPGLSLPRPASVPAVTHRPPAPSSTDSGAVPIDVSLRELSPPSRATRRGRWLALAAMGGLGAAAVLASTLVYVVSRPRSDASRAQTQPIPTNAATSVTYPLEPIQPTVTATQGDPPTAEPERASKPQTSGPLPALPLASSTGAGNPVAPPPSAAANGHPWSDDEIHDAVGFERAASGDPRACLAKYAELARTRPAVAARPDLVLLEARCQQASGDCAGGKATLRSRLSSSYAGEALDRAVDTASLGSCQKEKALDASDPKFQDRLGQVQKLAERATSARTAHDATKCREVFADATALGQKEGIGSDARLRQLLFGASTTSTMCLADTGDAKSCALAREQWRKSYKTSFPDLFAGGVDEASLDRMFKDSFPSCK